MDSTGSDTRAHFRNADFHATSGELMFNECSYGLGDYVHSGARWMYQANLALPGSGGVYIPGVYTGGTKRGDCNALRRSFSGGLVVTSFGCTDSNINMQGTANMDFSDENDIKGIIDGQVSAAGFTRTASMFRLISNPGGTSRTPIVPPAAGAEPKPKAEPGILETAGGFWGKLTGQGIASFAGGLTGGAGAAVSALAKELSIPKEALVLGAIAAVSLVVFGVLRSR